MTTDLFTTKETSIKLPNTFTAGAVSGDGRFVFLIGEQYTISITDDNLNMDIKIGLWVVDACLQTLDEYRLDLIDISEVHDIFVLDNDHAVLFAFSTEAGVFHQHLLQLDHVAHTAICAFSRHWRFPAANFPLAGIGDCARLSIVLSGVLSPENGGALISRLIPADPRDTRTRSLDLNVHVARLEQLMRESGDEVNPMCIWPYFMPLFHRGRIIFMLARNNDGRWEFHPSLVACIVLDDRKTRTELLHVNTDGFPSMDSGRPCSNHCSAVQRGRHVWLAAKWPAPATHWRWGLQKWANRLSTYALSIIGATVIFVSPIDGGRLTKLLAKFYHFVVGEDLFPDVGPTPSLETVVLDLDTLRWCRVPSVASTISARHLRHGRLCFDVADDGRALLIDQAPNLTSLRLFGAPSPWQVPRLETMALSAVVRIFPPVALADEPARRRFGIRL